MYKPQVLPFFSLLPLKFSRFLIQGISQHALKVSVLHNFTNIEKLFYSTSKVDNV